MFNLVGGVCRTTGESLAWLGRRIIGKETEEKRREDDEVEEVPLDSSGEEGDMGNSPSKHREKKAGQRQKKNEAKMRKVVQKVNYHPLVGDKGAQDDDSDVEFQYEAGSDSESQQSVENGTPKQHQRRFRFRFSRKNRQHERTYASHNVTFANLPGSNVCPEDQDQDETDFISLLESDSLTKLHKNFASSPRLNLSDDMGRIGRMQNAAKVVHKDPTSRLDDWASPVVTVLATQNQHPAKVTASASQVNDEKRIPVTKDWKTDLKSLFGKAQRKLTRDKIVRPQPEPPRPPKHDVVDPVIYLGISRYLASKGLNVAKYSRYLNETYQKRDQGKGGGQAKKNKVEVKVKKEDLRKVPAKAAREATRITTVNRATEALCVQAETRLAQTVIGKTCEIKQEREVKTQCLPKTLSKQDFPKKEIQQVPNPDVQLKENPKRPDTEVKVQEKVVKTATVAEETHAKHRQVVKPLDKAKPKPVVQQTKQEKKGCEDKQGKGPQAAKHRQVVKPLDKAKPKPVVQQTKQEKKGCEDKQGKGPQAAKPLDKTKPKPVVQQTKQEKKGFEDKQGKGPQAAKPLDKTKPKPVVQQTKPEKNGFEDKQGKGPQVVKPLDKTKTKPVVQQTKPEKNGFEDKQGKGPRAAKPLDKTKPNPVVQQKKQDKTGIGEQHVKVPQAAQPQVQPTPKIAVQPKNDDKRVVEEKKGKQTLAAQPQDKPKPKSAFQPKKQGKADVGGKQGKDPQVAQPQVQPKNHDKPAVIEKQGKETPASKPQGKPNLAVHPKHTEGKKGKDADAVPKRQLETLKPKPVAVIQLQKQGTAATDIGEKHSKEAASVKQKQQLKPNIKLEVEPKKHTKAPVKEKKCKEQPSVKQEQHETKAVPKPIAQLRKQNKLGIVEEQAKDVSVDLVKREDKPVVQLKNQDKAGIKEKQGQEHQRVMQETERQMDAARREKKLLDEALSTGQICMRNAHLMDEDKVISDVLKNKPLAKVQQEIFEFLDRVEEYKSTFLKGMKTEESEACCKKMGAHCKTHDGEKEDQVQHQTGPCPFEQHVLQLIEMLKERNAGKNTISRIQIEAQFLLPPTAKKSNAKRGKRNKKNKSDDPKEGCTERLITQLFEYDNEQLTAFGILLPHSLHNLKNREDDLRKRKESVVTKGTEECGKSKRDKKAKGKGKQVVQKAGKVVKSIITNVTVKELPMSLIPMEKPAHKAEEADLSGGKTLTRKKSTEFVGKEKHPKEVSKKDTRHATCHLKVVKDEPLGKSASKSSLQNSAKSSVRAALFVPPIKACGSSKTDDLEVVEMFSDDDVEQHKTPANLKGDALTSTAVAVHVTGELLSVEELAIVDKDSPKTEVRRKEMEGDTIEVKEPRHLVHDALTSLGITDQNTGKLLSVETIVGEDSPTKLIYPNAVQVDSEAQHHLQTDVSGRCQDKDRPDGATEDRNAWTVNSKANDQNKRVSGPEVRLTTNFKTVKQSLGGAKVKQINVVTSNAKVEGFETKQAVVTTDVTEVGGETVYAQLKDFGAQIDVQVKKDFKQTGVSKENSAMPARVVTENNGTRTTVAKGKMMKTNVSGENKKSTNIDHSSRPAFATKPVPFKEYIPANPSNRPKAVVKKRLFKNLEEFGAQVDRKIKNGSIQGRTALQTKVETQDGKLVDSRTEKATTPDPKTEPNVEETKDVYDQKGVSGNEIGETVSKFAEDVGNNNIKHVAKKVEKVGKKENQVRQGVQDKNGKKGDQEKTIGSNNMTKPDNAKSGGQEGATDQTPTCAKKKKKDQILRKIEKEALEVTPENPVKEFKVSDFLRHDQSPPAPNRGAIFLKHAMAKNLLTKGQLKQKNRERMRIGGVRKAEKEQNAIVGIYLAGDREKLPENNMCPEKVDKNLNAEDPKAAAYAKATVTKAIHSNSWAHAVKTNGKPPTILVHINDLSKDESSKTNLAEAGANLSKTGDLVEVNVLANQITDFKILPNVENPGHWLHVKPARVVAGIGRQANGPAVKDSNNGEIVASTVSSVLGRRA